MFNKKQQTPDKSGQAAPAGGSDTVRRPPTGAPSIISADLAFDGAISGDGELHVDGVVRGEISVTRLVVGEGANVEGKIRGAQVEIRGRVVGEIEAKSVRLYETCRVEGDITSDQLSIEAGARFQGRCQPSPEADRSNVIELGAG